VPAVLRELASLCGRYEGVIDIHLLGHEPAAHFAALADAGAQTVTVSAEAAGAGAIAVAREHGLQIGVALGADGDPSAAAGADIVLYTGVREHDDSAQQVRRLAEALPGIPIQVSGAVGEDNIKSLRAGGATVFVVGRAIFQREDLPRAYRRLVQELA
jgi:ribulose-phosphate 3-epimerase